MKKTQEVLESQLKAYLFLIKRQIFSSQSYHINTLCHHPQEMLLPLIIERI